MPREETRPWYESKGVWIGCGCCLGVIAVPLILATVLGVGVAGVVAGSDIFEQTMERVRSHPELVAELGEPIERSWAFHGALDIADGGGTADLTFPVTGPRGKANVSVLADKRGDSWQFRRLEAEVEGRSEPIDLLAGEPPPRLELRTDPAAEV